MHNKYITLYLSALILSLPFSFFLICVFLCLIIWPKIIKFFLFHSFDLICLLVCFYWPTKMMPWWNDDKMVVQVIRLVGPTLSPGWSSHCRIWGLCLWLYRSSISNGGQQGLYSGQCLLYVLSGCAVSSTSTFLPFTTKLSEILVEGQFQFFTLLISKLNFFFLLKSLLCFLPNFYLLYLSLNA